MVFTSIHQQWTDGTQLGLANLLFFHHNGLEMIRNTVEIYPLNSWTYPEPFRFCLHPAKLQLLLLPVSPRFRFSQDEAFETSVAALTAGDTMLTTEEDKPGMGIL